MKRTLLALLVAGVLANEAPEQPPSDKSDPETHVTEQSADEDPHAYAEDLDHDEHHEHSSEEEKDHPLHSTDHESKDGYDAGDPDVLNVHEETFDAVLKQHKYVLFNFYSHKSDPETE